MTILIKNGYVINPATNTEEYLDILIDENIITKIGNVLDIQVDKIIDATGMYVMPGFIDLHVHLREPGFEYKETIITGSMAAAKGGYTTICAMPNTNPVIDNEEMVNYIYNKAKEEAVVNILPIGAITRGQVGEELADITRMKKAGIVALSEDGKSVMKTSLYLEGMKVAKELGIPIFAHCEEKDLVHDGVINEGLKAEELGLSGISNGVEDVIVARDIILAKQAGVRLHLCHCSTKDSVEFIKLAKRASLPVTGEVCPHHFSMSDDEIPGDDSNYKMNPPLRSREDVKALIKGLQDDVIDIIATDHAPHSLEEKMKSFRDAPFGIVGLETAFSLTMTNLIKPGYLTPMQMVEKMSYNPAKILGIDRGSLEVGKIADIVMADPKKEYVIDVNEFLSKGKNTPFKGKKVVGRVRMTMVGGRIVYQDR